MSSAALLPALRTNPLGQHRQDSQLHQALPSVPPERHAWHGGFLACSKCNCVPDVCDVCVCPQTLQYFVVFQISPQFSMCLMIYLSRVSSRQQQQQQTIGKQLAQQDGQGKKWCHSCMFMVFECVLMFFDIYFDNEKQTTEYLYSFEILHFNLEPTEMQK